MSTKELDGMVEVMVEQVGVQTFLESVARYLRNADQSAAGETGRRQADVIDALANWEW